MSDEENIGFTVQIMDHDYRVLCSRHEQEVLLAAADDLNGRMKDIRDAGKSMGVERIAVMAALNVCYELLKCKKELTAISTNHDKRLQQLLNRVETALSKASP